MHVVLEIDDREIDLGDMSMLPDMGDGIRVTLPDLDGGGSTAVRLLVTARDFERRMVPSVVREAVDFGAGVAVSREPRPTWVCVLSGEWQATTP